MPPVSRATRPTFYFIGVTTAKSSIMKVFPAWAKELGLGDVQIKGMDFPLHAEPAAYRTAVEFIRDDPLSLGALVTTHKIDLFHACRDLFDVVDPFAALTQLTGIGLVLNQSKEILRLLQEISVEDVVHLLTHEVPFCHHL